MSGTDRPLRVLLVEDDDAVRRVAVLALERVGKETVLACSHGAEALDRVDGFAPDIVLLDVMMPEMDGPQTLAALRARERWADVPVVFLTAKVSPEETEALRALGAAGVLAKPFEPLRLAAQVRAIYAERGSAQAGASTKNTVPDSSET